MKHLLFALLLVLLPTQTILANTVVRSGDTVTLAENQSIDGSFYVVGGTVALSGKVIGDTTIIGGNVTVGGEVTKDLAILAGTVSLQSPVAEDARIIAGQVTITESVAGNLVVIAGKLNISSKAKISGDILFYGGELVLEGDVKGKLLGSADTVRVDSVVGGGIDIKARVLTLGEQAEITGGVKYTSPTDLVRAPGATVEGTIVKNDVVVDAQSNFQSRQIAIMFLVSLFATLTIYLIFRRLTESFAEAVRSGILVKSIVGFIFIFMTPLLIVLLTVSLLGSIVAMVIFAVFMLLLVLSVPLLAVSAGSLIASVVDRKSRVTVPYLLLGAVVVHLALLVPVIGAAVVLWLYFATVGTLLDQLYRHAR